MLEWFQSIGDTIITLIDFLISFIQNVIELIGLVFKALPIINSVLLFLPVQYTAPIAVIVAFSVIVAIIHFGG